MRIRDLGYMAALTVLLLSPAIGLAKCQLAELGSLPVEMQGARPLVWTKINGVKARFMLDSGLFYSVISRDAATQYQLRVTSISAGGGYYIRGTGGSERAQQALVKSFELLGVDIPNVEFLVIDQSMGNSWVGLLGQNVLRVSDVEYDLANGVVRLFKPVGCEHQPLAYWAVSTPSSSVDLESMDALQPSPRAAATINGHRITVEFDTSSPRSFLSLDAAERAGISPGSSGTTFLGLVGGIGPGTNKLWSASVDTFELGGEKVQHAQLLISDLNPHRIGEVSNAMPDMVLGEDFFLSHRIYVAYSQKKLYFTYNGGPLFNLNLPQGASVAGQPGVAPGAASQASAVAAAQPDSDAPTDADGFRRRGMAFASMREFDRALADLTRACDLAPRDTENRYRRGVIFAQVGQFKAALQDYSAAIALQPDDIDALVARAGLLQLHPDVTTDATAQIKADLDVVNRFATPAADVRLTLGQMYGKLGDYPAAVDQIDRWLSHHPLNGEQIAGFNALCWLRATSNRDLQDALDDCNRALDLKPRGPEETGSLIRGSVASDDPDVLDSRALVYLRLGKPEDARRDYTAALQINPSMPSSLFGRGVAEFRLGERAQGQDDVTAAEKLDSGVAGRFLKMGLVPY